MFSRDFCENFWNTFLIELVRVIVLFKEIFSLPRGTLKRKYYFNMVSTYYSYVLFVIAF